MNIINEEKLKQVWRNMIFRCSGKVKYYENIKVCPAWKNYMAFRSWALTHGYAEGLILDRINNEGNYSPKNCRWTDRRTSGINRRIQANNELGVRGIRYRAHINKYEAHLYYYKRYIHIGHYNTLPEAIQARNDFIDRYGYENYKSYIPKLKEQ